MSTNGTLGRIIDKQKKAEENEKNFWKNISDINKKINSDNCNDSGGEYKASNTGHDTCNIQTINNMPVTIDNCKTPQYEPVISFFGLGKKLKSCKKPMRFDLLIDKKTLENTNDPKIKNRIEKHLPDNKGGKRKSKTNKRKRKTKITRKKRNH